MVNHDLRVTFCCVFGSFLLQLTHYEYCDFQYFQLDVLTYIYLHSDPNGTLPSILVNGHYSSDAETPVEVYHYVESAIV